MTDAPTPPAGPMTATAVRARLVDTLRRDLIGPGPDDIDLARAGHPDDPHVRGVAQAHRTCQVRGGVPSGVAAKGQNDRLEAFHHITPSKITSTWLNI